jgi:hypothetical protein
MAFDINSAKPAAVATARPKFDIASAKPVEPSTWEKIKSGVGKVNDFVGDNIIQPVAGAGEIALTAASGIVGDTAGNISGLAAIPLHAAGVIDTEPQAVKDAVSGAVTYQPRTEGAQAALRTIAKPFEMLEESKQRTADIAGEASGSGAVRDITQGALNAAHGGSRSSGACAAGDDTGASCRRARLQGSPLRRTGDQPWRKDQRRLGRECRRQRQDSSQLHSR